MSSVSQWCFFFPSPQTRYCTDSISFFISAVHTTLCCLMPLQLSAIVFLERSIQDVVPMWMTLPFFPFLLALYSSTVFHIIQGGVDRHGGRETLREVGFIWPYNINVPLCIMYSAPKLTVSAWPSPLRLRSINKFTRNLDAVSLNGLNLSGLFLRFSDKHQPT